MRNRYSDVAKKNCKIKLLLFFLYLISSGCFRGYRMGLQLQKINRNVIAKIGQEKFLKLIASSEPTEKIILGKNYEALGEQGEGSKIAASVALATTIGQFYHF